jgi:DNA repair protein RadD
MPSREGEPLQEQQGCLVTRQLRPYQAQLFSDVHQEWASGKANVVAVSATGSGKTVIAAALIAAERQASVFIAHRTELVSQASLALAREGIPHRVIGPKSLGRNCAQIHMTELRRTYFDPNARCAVAGVDTLVRMDPNDPWFHQIGMWVCDEAAHLLEGNKWGRAVAMFPHAKGVGFTATPLRSDGKGLGRHADGVFDSMVLGPPMRKLLDDGYLTDYRIFCPPNDLDLRAVSTSASGDFSPGPLRKAVHKSHIVGDVVSHYKRIAAGKLGMTFCVDVEAATETAEAFRKAGVPAQVITGKTPDLLRAQLMQRFRNREILQLVSVDILGEGVDVPAVEVVSMARPTQSFSLYCQQLGRGLRLMEGKTHALILDHVGNVARHGLPDAYREWSLDRRERRSRATPQDAIPVRTCLNERCLSVYERIYSACPFCGHEVVPAGRTAPEQVDGDLTELDSATLAALRGEKARIDGDARVPPGSSPAVAGAIRRTHWERQEAQAPLRAAIALWAGWQNSLGRPDPEVYRRFYFKFGVDVMSAQVLGAREAAELTERVSAELARHSVTSLESA